MTALDDLIRADFPKRQANAILAVIAASSGGGGGGSFGGTTVVTNVSPGRTVTGVTGGQRIAFNNWSAANYVGSHPGPAITVDNVNFQWTPTLAGWYQISWNVLVEFSAAAPASVRFENSNYWDNFGMNMDLPVFGADIGSGNGRQSPGYQGRLTSNVFYTEAAATVGLNGVKPFMYWAGTPTINRLSLAAEITRMG